MYRALILDHYKNPRNAGRLRNPTHSAGHANVSCGDAIQIHARIKNGAISEIAFTGSGCAISIAGASLLTDYAKGRSLTALKKLSLKDIEKLLGIPISKAREKCAMMGVETVQRLRPVT